MKSLFAIITASLATSFLVSCATAPTPPPETEDPRALVQKAIEKEQKNISKCSEINGKKFTGIMTYDIEFNNRLVTSTKLIETTFKTRSQALEACMEKAIKNIQLDHQKDNLPYNIQYPFPL